MKKVVIIADDLTGANATGVLLARERLKTVTLLEECSQGAIENYDVIALTTNSRGLSQENAYNEVYKAVNRVKDIDFSFINKRIDSTLRGNIGAEIDAVMDIVQDAKAVVVAAFPTSQRVSIGGFLMVNNTPLEKTGVAKDPKNPINTSMIVEIIRKQTKRTVDYISLQTVLSGTVALTDTLSDKLNNHADIVVVDATTDEDIKTVASACKALGRKIITVDPGPFTYYYAKEFMESSNRTKTGKKILATIGSVSDLTRRQIQDLMLSHNAYVLKAETELFLSETTRQEEIDRISKNIIKEINRYSIFAIVTTLSNSDVLDLELTAKNHNSTIEKISNLINTALAEAAHKIINGSMGKIGGIYTSGGDITVAFCSMSDTKGIEVKDNVIPLAVYGRLIKGTFPGFPVITKGGMIGDDSTLTKCIDYLVTKTSTD